MGALNNHHGHLLSFDFSPMDAWLSIFLTFDASSRKQHTKPKKGPAPEKALKREGGIGVQTHSW